jgi:hypothetical protein
VPLKSSYFVELQSIASFCADFGNSVAALNAHHCDIQLLTTMWLWVDSRKGLTWAFGQKK